MKFKYEIRIWWSAEDKCYIANVVELGEFFLAHGETYAEALVNIQNALEHHIEILNEEGIINPKPRIKRKNRDIQKS